MTLDCSPALVLEGGESIPEIGIVFRVPLSARLKARRFTVVGPVYGIRAGFAGVVNCWTRVRENTVRLLLPSE